MQLCLSVLVVLTLAASIGEVLSTAMAPLGPVVPPGDRYSSKSLSLDAVDAVIAHRKQHIEATDKHGNSQSDKTEAADKHLPDSDYFKSMKAGLSFLQRGSDSTKPKRGRVTPENIKLLQENEHVYGKTAAATREQSEQREEMESMVQEGKRNWIIDQEARQKLTMNLRREESRAQDEETNDDDNEVHPHKRQTYNSINAEYFNEGLSFLQRGSDPKKPKRGRVTPENIKLLQENDARTGKTAAEAREQSDKREEMESMVHEGKRNWIIDQMERQKLTMNLRREEARAQDEETNDDDNEEHPHKRQTYNSVNAEYFNEGLSF